MSTKTSSKNTLAREKSVLFGFAKQKKLTNGKVTIAIMWGRLFSTFVALFVAGWLGVSGLLYLYFKYRKDFEEVRFLGMIALPFRMDAHREEMGDYQIKRGISELKEQNYREALSLLRTGVIRSPNNLEGRSILAEFYEIALKRPDTAADLMIEGLEPDGKNELGYLKKALRILMRHQMDSEIQNIADKYLPEQPELTDINRTLAFGAANANYLRGNYDRADDYLLTYRLIESLEGLLLSAQISWDRGNQKSAISKMENSLQTFSNSELLLMQLSKFHREIGNLDEARRYAILRNIADPLSVAPRMELLYIYNKSGDTEREARETWRLLQQFREDAVALQALANFAADTGNVELARRTYEEALENEFGIDSFALLLIEAHLVDKDYLGALEFSEELLKERPEWLGRQSAIFNSLRAVASYGSDRPDLGEIYLQDYLDETANTPQTHLAVAGRFSDIGRPQQAQKVLRAAYTEASSNQMVLSELIRVELELGNTENLNTLLTRLLQMRRPQVDLLLEAYQKLGSDRFIFTPNRKSLLIELSSILRANSETILKVGS
ncbi:MAG: tetratricopeptide repeat protein [Lentimonas sp.]